ncbi:hypothetical protein B0H17DRAFT_1142363 [Mycena rosella]|uniref:Uncharacterized protein n=1 Tax=Mycena rosella TaxID=1033263 RepID=A0AAD7CY08_MYCRO|nr:hypothetical protein B0H17DRAFT_1142363 [Mycena rosella]
MSTPGVVHVTRDYCHEHPIEMWDGGSLEGPEPRNGLTTIVKLLWSAWGKLGWYRVKFASRRDKSVTSGNPGENGRTGSAGWRFQFFQSAAGTTLELRPTFARVSELLTTPRSFLGAYKALSSAQLQSTISSSFASSSTPSFAASSPASAQPKDYAAAFATLQSAYGLGGQAPSISSKKSRAKSTATVGKTRAFVPPQNTYESAFGALSSKFGCGGGAVV